MSQVLTEADTLICSHAAPLTLTGSTKLIVGDKGVLTEDAVKAATVPTCTGNPNGTGKCATVGAVTGGKATKLFVGESPVLLSDSFGANTSGTPSKASV